MKLLNTTLLSLTLACSAFAHSNHGHVFHEENQIRSNYTFSKDLSSRNIENIYRAEKKIVLTIDDGPTSWATPKVLDVLDKHNVKATFFVIGNQASDPKNRTIMERMQAAGHVVANHSLSHAHFGKISGLFGLGVKKKVLEEFQGGHESIAPFISESQQLYFRAPGASWNGKAAKYINKTDIGKKYIGPVLWDIGGANIKNTEGKITSAADWACWSAKWAVSECLEGYVNRTIQTQGGVVLFHDINSKSAQLMDEYITEVKKRGYQFVTIDDIDF